MQAAAAELRKQQERTQPEWNENEDMKVEAITNAALA